MIRKHHFNIWDIDSFRQLTAVINTLGTEHIVYRTIDTKEPKMAKLLCVLPLQQTFIESVVR